MRIILFYRKVSISFKISFVVSTQVMLINDFHVVRWYRLESAYVELYVTSKHQVTLQTGPH